MTLPFLPSPARARRAQRRRRIRRDPLRCVPALERLEDRLAPYGSFILPYGPFIAATNTTVPLLPISITSLSDSYGHVGLASATLAVTYPTGVFGFPIGGNQATADVNLADIPLSDTAGAGGASDWNLTANSPADGQLSITLTAMAGDQITTNTFPTGGPLVWLRVPILASAPAGNAAINVVSVSGSTQTQVVGGGSGNQTYLLAGFPATSIIDVVPLYIDTYSLTDWTVNFPYRQSIIVSGGTGPYTFTSSGGLPPGLVLSANGTLSGTPSRAGVYQFPVTATDSLGVTNTTSFTITINPPLMITTTAVPDGAVNGGYGGSISTSGGTAPLTFTMGGLLPSGMTLQSNGTIYGEPSYAGTYTFTVQATDVAGSSDTRTFTLFVPIALDPHAFPNATADTPGYRGALGGYGGTGPVTYSVEGSLPPGLTLSSSGSVSGTPLTAGAYTFTINATDRASNTGSQTYTVVIYPPLTFTATIADGRVNHSYFQPSLVSGGSAPYTFAGGQDLPAGITLTNTGALSGIATQGGKYTFYVSVTDSIGATAYAIYTLNIVTISFVTQQLPDWDVNRPGYNQTIATSGAIGPVTFTQSGRLPPGLTFSSAGVVSGTPDVAGPYGIDVTATDAIGTTATISFRIIIYWPVSVFLPVNTLATLGSRVNPVGSLLEDNIGDFFGITRNGGAYTGGSVFELSKGSSSAVTLANFYGSSGTYPFSLLMDSAGNLIGTTADTVFEVSRGSNTITVLADGFSDAANAELLPSTALVEDSYGDLFGAAIGFGAGDGAIYELPAGTSHVIYLADFNGANGASPNGTLALDSKGDLFGTTAGNGGNLFELPAGSNTIVSLVSFSAYGSFPNGGIIEDSNGDWFGTTKQGGAYGDGTVFEYMPGAGLITLASFDQHSGELPTTGVIEDSNGNLFGMTAVAGGFYSGMGDGTIYELKAGSGTITPLITFDGTNGQQPAGGLIEDSNGNLFGTSGGLYGEGTVFELPARPADGFVGRQYTQTFGVTGGTGTATFAATGTFPPGLTFSTAGVLSGTPTTIGRFAFSVTATDSSGASGSAAYTVTVDPNVTPTSLSKWTVGQPGYRQTLAAAGGAAPYAFGAIGTLPTGLTLSSGGILSGTPATAGSFSFIVSATDRNGSTGSQVYTVTINPLPSITSATLSDGAFERPGYAQSITTSGGTGNLAFSASGSLPSGLTLSTGGVLAGTPTVVGNFTFTVAVTDSTGASAGGSVTITVAPSVMPFSLPAWVINQANYDQTLSGAGGTGPYTFTESSTLPPGLTLSSSGVLSGTPTAAGMFTFTVSATDNNMQVAKQNYTIVINPPLAITTSSLSSWTINHAGYSQTITATGGLMPTFTASGTLPPGLALNSKGVLSGTPTTMGSYDFVVIVSDSFGTMVTQSYTVTIMSVPVITTVTLPSWTVLTYGYKQTINATGGAGSLTFSATGSLPPGLTLSRTGILSDTPNTTGSYSFTVLATDSTGVSASQGYILVINPLVSVNTTNLASGSAGAVYNQMISAQGGTVPYTFGVGPPNLIVNGSFEEGNTGFTSQYTYSPGNLRAVGEYDVVSSPSLDGLESFGDHTSGHGLMLAINGAQALGVIVWSETVSVQPAMNYVFSFYEAAASAISPPTLDVQFNGAIGGVAGPMFNNEEWGHFVVGWNSGAATSVTISINDVMVAPSGNDFALDDFSLVNSSATTGLPPGLTLSTYGVLSGTPTMAGTYNFGVTATDGANASASQPYMLVIAPPATVLPGVTAGNYYDQSLASGGNGTATFSSSGTMPPGLALSSVGELSGMPTVSGTYTFIVMVTDVHGTTTNQAYTLTINPGAFAHYLVSAVSSSVQAGAGVLVTVQAADQFNNPVDTYSGPGTVSVTMDPASAGSSVPASLNLDSNGFGYFLASVQQPGSYTIRVASGSFSTTSNVITVTPGPPVKLVFTASASNLPTGAPLPALSVAVEDRYGNVIASDNSDTVTIDVGSGPGSFTSGSTLTASVQNGVAIFNSLTLITPGTYQLSAVVPGLYTGPYSAAFTVLPLQVVPGSFAGTPSGFSLEFNAPVLVNATTPVLYGTGNGSSAPPPSVIVTTDPGNLSDTAAYVAGSLVLNATSTTLTFLATDTTLEGNNGSPLLPDGTYTAIVRSSSSTDGLQALNPGGGFLDGLGSGTAGSGDFLATFTVNAAASHDDVLWLPDTADGPGQALNAPGKNQAGGGYPVYLNDGTGTVSQVQMILNYDPTLLTITGVSGAGFALLSSWRPGRAVLQYSGAALPAGKQMPIGFISATVPSGTSAKPMPYGAEDLLHLTNVLINGGRIPVATSDGLHLVAYVGDANGDGAYTGDDAMRITRVVLQTDSGLAAYPRVDPVIVADTDGRGFIPADAALQANEAGVGVPTVNLAIPPIPFAVHFANNVGPINPSMTVSPEDPRSQAHTLIASHATPVSPVADLLDQLNWDELGTALDWLGMVATGRKSRCGTLW